MYMFYDYLFVLYCTADQPFGTKNPIYDDDDDDDDLFAFLFAINNQTRGQSNLAKAALNAPHTLHALGLCNYSCS